MISLKTKRTARAAPHGQKNTKRSLQSMLSDHINITYGEWVKLMQKYAEENANPGVTQKPLRLYRID